MSILKWFFSNLAVCIVLASVVTLSLFVFVVPEPSQTSPDRFKSSGEKKSLHSESLRFSTTSLEKAVVSQLARRVSEVFGVSEEHSIEYSKWIVQASQEHRVPEDIIVAVIATESHFDHKAVSSIGAIGLAQIHPKYWSKNCTGDIRTDARANVHCGAKVLSHYYRERCSNNASCALAMYNVGPSTYLNKSNEPAVDRYLTKIRRNLRQFKGIIPAHSSSSALLTFNY